MQGKGFEPKFTGTTRIDIWKNIGKKELVFCLFFCHHRCSFHVPLVREHDFWAIGHYFEVPLLSSGTYEGNCLRGTVSSTT